MNLYIKNIIHAAIAAGQEAGDKELAREKYRNFKTIEQLVENFKAKAEESEHRRVAALVKRVDSMCNSLEAQKHEFNQNLMEFERASLAMKERAMLHQTQALDWAAQMAALKQHADEARVNAQAAALEADKHRRAGVIMQQSIDAMQRCITQEQAATKKVGKQWSDDVELMQSQLQNEVAARIAAEERLHEASDACRRGARQEEEEEEREGAKNVHSVCVKCKDTEDKEELLGELQSAVTLLNNQLSAVYREKAAADKERERLHAKALHVLRDEMSELLVAARNGQAFAEKVAQRLEHELLKHSQTLVQQQQLARGQQAPGLKRRLGAGKQHTEFKDFTADVERLTGGGASTSTSAASAAKSRVASVAVREPLEHELAWHAHTPHTQLPAMHPAHPPPFPFGTARPSSGRLGGGGCGVGGGGGVEGSGAGREKGLGEIRKATPPIPTYIAGTPPIRTYIAGTPPIRASATNRSVSSSLCPPLNLASVVGGGSVAIDACGTDRGGVLAGGRRMDDTCSRDAIREGPGLRAARGVVRKGSYSAR